MDNIRIGFLRGLGYILSFLFVSLIIIITIVISVCIKKRIINNQSEEYINQTIDNYYIKA